MIENEEDLFQILRDMLKDRWNMWAKYYVCMDKERSVFPGPAPFNRL